MHVRIFHLRQNTSHVKNLTSYLLSSKPLSHYTKSKLSRLDLPKKLHKIHENLAAYVTNSNFKHPKIIRYTHDAYAQPKTGQL